MTTLKLNWFKIKHICQQIILSEEYILNTLQDRESLYKKAIIPKKEPGQFRTIYCPKKQYKQLLRKFNKFLLKKYTPPQGVCGGIPNKCIKDMVEPHCDQEAIFVLDLKDFYPNISKNLLNSFLCNVAKCSTKVSALLSKLFTAENKLAQGFPTSSTLANIVASKLDLEHLNIAKKYNLKRTRWIDDIVFSGSYYNLSKAIPSIKKAVEINGFKINTKKTSFIRKNNNPEVVGIRVDSNHPYIPKKIIQEIEDIITYAIQTDLDSALNLYQSTFNKPNIKNLYQALEGKIQYVFEFNPIDGYHLQKKLHELKQKQPTTQTHHQYAQ